MYCENLFLNFPNAGKFSLSFVIDFLYERNTIISGLSKYLYLLFGQVFSQHQWLYTMWSLERCVFRNCWIHVCLFGSSLLMVLFRFSVYLLIFYPIIYSIGYSEICFAIRLLGWEFVILYNFPFYSIGFSFIYIKTI